MSGSFTRIKVMSTIYKLFGYNFWFNFLEFRDKISLTIQLRLFNEVKYRDAICLKYE